jgi:hypothetical protein
MTTARSSIAEAKATAAFCIDLFIFDSGISSFSQISAQQPLAGV